MFSNHLFRVSGPVSSPKRLFPNRSNRRRAMTSTVDVAYITAMRGALTQFHTEVAKFLAAHGHDTSPGSKAAIELQTYSRNESIVSAWGIGVTLIEFGSDHLTAFVKHARAGGTHRLLDVRTFDARIVRSCRLAFRSDHRRSNQDRKDFRASIRRVGAAGNFRLHRESRSGGHRRHRNSDRRCRKGRFGARVRSGPQ